MASYSTNPEPPNPRENQMHLFAIALLSFATPATGTVEDWIENPLTLTHSTAMPQELALQGIEVLPAGLASRHDTVPALVFQQGGGGNYPLVECDNECQPSAFCLHYFKGVLDDAREAADEQYDSDMDAAGDHLVEDTEACNGDPACEIQALEDYALEAYNAGQTRDAAKSSAEATYVADAKESCCPEEC